MKQFLIIIILSCFATGNRLCAQNADSSLVAKTQDSLALAKQNKKKTYSIARRSSIMSAIVPGLGQVYNHKYWKVPFIYAGLGGFGYMFLQNNKEYNYFRRSVINYYNVSNDSLALANTGYRSEQLQTQKLYYRKYRDLTAFGFVIIYVLNIIDANVDGHLRTFDVSDDLSLRIDPWQNIYGSHYGYSTSVGLSLKLNFK